MNTTMNDPSGRWMTRRAAAAHLGIGTSTLDRLVSRGAVRKYTAPGMPPLYDRHELDAYVTEHGRAGNDSE